MIASSKKLSALCAAAFCTISLLFGCSGQPGTQAEGSSAASGGSTNQSAVQPANKTVVVTDAKGEVEIPADPQRVVDLSGTSDILHILGYSVVGTANSDAYDYKKFPSFLEDTLHGAAIVGYSYQDTMDVENILSLKPDLIIISTIQEKMYEQLKAAAPTVMIKLAQTNWQDDLMTMAKIFKKEAKARSWLDGYLSEAAKAGQGIRAAYGENSSYLALLASGGQIYVFDATGLGSVFYDDMGLMRPKGMPQQENVSLPVITYEGLAAIDADYIFVVGTDEDMAVLHGNAIWKSLPAVRTGHVVELPASPYFNQGYSPIGRQLFLKEMPAMMEKLAT